MFYENYVRLCNSVGKAPTAVATELGFQKSAVTRWKKGCQPTDATRSKIADYFGVTTEELCADAPARPARAAVNGDDELTEYLEQLAARPELRMLFSVSKDATKADVEQAVAIIEALRRAREGS